MLPTVRILLSHPRMFRSFMTKPPVHETISSGGDRDITAATERLFQDIAEASNSDAVRTSMLAMNSQMYAFRPYEAALIPDLHSEYEALSACWAKRDMVELQRLILAYFKRRQDLAPQLAALINRPN